jgi:hypothetical protein
MRRLWPNLSLKPTRVRSRLSFNVKVHDAVTFYPSCFDLALSKCYGTTHSGRGRDYYAGAVGECGREGEAS